MFDSLLFAIFLKGLLTEVTLLSNVDRININK